MIATFEELRTENSKKILKDRRDCSKVCLECDFVDRDLLFERVFFSGTDDYLQNDLK